MNEISRATQQTVAATNTNIERSADKQGCASCEPQVSSISRAIDGLQRVSNESGRRSIFRKAVKNQGNSNQAAISLARSYNQIQRKSSGEAARNIQRSVSPTINRRALAMPVQRATISRMDAVRQVQRSFASTNYANVQRSVAAAPTVQRGWLDKVKGAAKGAWEGTKKFAKANWREGLDLAVGLIPGVSTVKGVLEAATGKNFITGKKLSPGERAMALAGAIPGGAYVKAGAKFLKVGAKLMPGVAKIGAKLLPKLGGMATKLGGKYGSKLLSKITPKISGIANKLKGTVTSKLGTIANKVKGTIASKFPKAGKLAGRLLKHGRKEMSPEKLGKLAQAIVGKDETGKSLKAFARIKTGLKAIMPEKYVGKLKDLVTKKIKGKAGKVFDAVKQKGLAKFNSVKSKVLNKLGIKLGGGGGQGKIGKLIAGAKNKLGGLKNKIGGTISSIKSKVGGKVSPIKNKIGGTVSSIKNKIGGKINSVKNKIGGKVSSIKSKIGGIFKGNGGSAKPSKIGNMVSQARGKIGGLMSKGKTFAGKVAKALEIPTTKAKFMKEVKKRAVDKFKEKAKEFGMEKLKGWFGGKKKAKATP